MKWILNCFCDKNPRLTLSDERSRQNVECKLFFKYLAGFIFTNLSFAPIHLPIFNVRFIISGVLNMATSAENPLRFSCHTLDKATKAKVSIFYYFNNVLRFKSCHDAKVLFGFIHIKALINDMAN